MRLQPYEYDLFCVTCPWGSEDRHPVILFTGTDKALWDSTKYRNENKISSASKVGSLTPLCFAQWQVAVSEFLYCQWGSDWEAA